ncbi:hypothetical protein G4G28_13095 [Massilia sp. Dwa41.01b]|uniref:anti-sigma factor n=1 Tax=Massilia sp. Dwa41.01b TaxID=2709302 RepID=UPI001602F90A|nr:hypothetical protein [Massilia sp. Dwa41.01b]QNA89169.1 hypothetical protein G4G28_13095 [Massilia sp. Dwa41.01b]
MNFSDEILMAYADGELAEPERSAVERALREDPAVAAAVERHRALRADVFAAFAGVLDEPVPERLVPPRPAPVHSLEEARAARASQAAQPAARQATVSAPRSSWAQWGGMAAALVIGVLAGSIMLGGRSDGQFVADAGGRLVAQAPAGDGLDAATGERTGQRAGAHRHQLRQQGRQLLPQLPAARQRGPGLPRGRRLAHPGAEGNRRHRQRESTARPPARPRPPCWKRSTNASRARRWTRRPNAPRAGAAGSVNARGMQDGNGQRFRLA